MSFAQLGCVPCIYVTQPGHPLHASSHFHSPNSTSLFNHSVGTHPFFLTRMFTQIGCTHPWVTHSPSHSFLQWAFIVQPYPNSSSHQHTRPPCIRSPDAQPRSPSTHKFASPSYSLPFTPSCRHICIVPTSEVRTPTMNCDLFD